MRKIFDTAYLTCGVLSASLLVAICGLVFAQVLLNLIVKTYGMITGTGLSLSISSYGQIAGYMLACASTLALPYTFNKGGHIRMTLLHHAVSSRVRYVFDILCVLFAGAVTVFLTFDMARLTLDSFNFGDLSDGIVKIPIWIPQIVMTAGLSILVIALLDALIELLVKGQTSSTKSEDDTASSAYTS